MPELTLTDDERETLVRWSRRATSTQALAQRCRIVLGCAEGRTNQPDRCGTLPARACIGAAPVRRAILRRAPLDDDARGGHFAAPDEPELLAEDITAFAEQLGLL